MRDHTIPPCPHFGPCGGCQLQHFAYDAQIRLKADQLRALLEPLGVALPELQLHPSPPLAYRNRIRLTLMEAEGRLRAGYIRNPASDVPGAASFSVLPVTQCPIAAPILWRTAEAFLTLVNTSASLWLRNPQQRPDQLELFTNGDESALQFTLYLRTQARTLPAKLASAFSQLCESLRIQIPPLNGAGIVLLPLANADRSRRIETARPGPTWGKPGLLYTVGDLDYWVPRTAFFQANRFLLPDLLTIVTGNRTGAMAWDLYAGVGLFTRALAQTFTQVTAVEVAEPANAALAATRIPNLQVFQATTLDFLRAAVLQRERPGLIVLDPPRSGAGPEVCALLHRIAAPTLVYVSCGPQVLPADLALLIASGYTLTEIHLFDLFPQTSQIETVAILTR